MKLRIVRLITVASMLIVLGLATPSAFSQQDNKNKSTAGGQMKQSGKEMGKAGKSLGHNVKHGRIVRGGKRFGQHVGRAARHAGSGTKKAVKKAVKP